MLPRSIVFLLLTRAEVGSDGLGTHLGRERLGAHAEPEVVPKVRAGTHGAISVDGVELGGGTVAVPGVVKGIFAGHGGGEDGFIYGG